MNWNNQFSATDVPWLATIEKYMSIGGTAFDQLVPNKLWASDGIGVWNTNVQLTAQWTAPVVWNLRALALNNWYANQIIVPPGGKPVVAAWDRRSSMK